MPSSDSVRFLSVAPKKRRLILPRPLRLSPRDTMAYIWMTTRAREDSTSAAWEQAVAWFRRAIEANRNYPSSIFPIGRRSRATRSTRRGAFRRQGRPRAQPGLHHLPRPRRLGRRGATTRRIWPSLSPFSTAYARPGPRTMTAARRLAAILAADVVGYSRLMGQDEAGTAKAVRSGREAPRRSSRARRPHRQDDGRRRAAWSFPRRRRRMRDRDPEADGRAQRRDPEGKGILYGLASTSATS